ncbi:hypothetical protein NPIL_19911 [Nephila pilipes]|uniref:C2H2-type domain-containing protein n=1 Tax=Nephila pilipes TaxID=299642 RepID=A0A8X6U5R7_NEPPI|nr:hypothetical protein NPIL_19911 [Nephila pilipes]
MMRTAAAERESARRPMCPVCRKYFYDITTLRRHMEIHDSQRQKYVCKFLNSGLHPSLWKQKFVIKRRSSPATNLVMEGLDLSSSRSTRPTCPICSKCFYNSGTLNRHIEIHFLERKTYKCDICDKRFSWKNALNAHLRRDHDVVI